MKVTKKWVFISFFICIFYLIILKFEKNSTNIEFYPKKPIEVIIAYKEGGGTDIGARTLVSIAQKKFSIPFKITYILGEDGINGYKKLLNSKPDGYTIGFINFPSFLSLSLRQKIPFKRNDLEIILNHVLDPGVLIVNSNSKWKNFEEFYREAKKNPNKLTIANNGVGLSNHLGAAYFAHESGIKLTHVPFNGSTDMLTALKLGYVDAAVAKISEVFSMTNKKEFRALLSFTDKRLKYFKETPTAKEYGYNVIFGSYRTLIAPKNTPKPILEILHKIFKETIYSNENLRESEKLAIPLYYLSPEEMDQILTQEEEYLKTLIPKLEI